MRWAIKNEYARLGFVQRYKHTYSKIFKEIQELRHIYLRGRLKVFSCIEDQESACKKHDDNNGDGDNNVDFDDNSSDDDGHDDNDDDDNKINSPLAASVASERGKDTSGGGGRQPRMMTIAPMMMMMMMMMMIKTGGSLKGCFPRPRLVCVFDVFLNYTSFVTKEPN